MTEKPLRVVFAPGCLEQLESELNPEELQEFMDQLQQSIDAGTLFEDSNELDMDELERTDPDLHQLLQTQLSKLDDFTPPTLN